MPTKVIPPHPLTTISNYECIKRGKVPGVDLNFPVELHDQLFARQQKHKMDERTRRCRLAQAIRELESAVLQSKSAEENPGVTRSKLEVVKTATALITRLRDRIHELEHMQASGSIRQRDDIVETT